MGAMVGGGRGSGQVRLWRPRQAGAPLGSLSCHGARGGAATGSGWWFMPAPVPFIYRPMGRPHGNTLGPHPAGERTKSIRLPTPCPLALQSRPPRRSPSVMPLSACTMSGG